MIEDYSREPHRLSAPQRKAVLFELILTLSGPQPSAFVLPNHDVPLRSRYKKHSKQRKKVGQVFLGINRFSFGNLGKIGMISGVLFVVRS